MKKRGNEIWPRLSLRLQCCKRLLCHCLECCLVKDQGDKFLVDETFQNHASDLARKQFLLNMDQKVQAIAQTLSGLRWRRVDKKIDQLLLVHQRWH